MISGINSWLDNLANKPIPIFRHRRDQALAILKDDERASSECLPVILADPGMAANLFRHINQSREKSNRIQITNVSSLISLLGVSRLIEEITAMICVEELNLPEARLKGIQRSLKENWYCRLFARQWLMDRGVHETEEVQVAAQLQMLPELMLWCYGDDVMSTIAHKSYFECLDYEQQSNELLGCDQRDIGDALVQKWFLPELAGFAFQSNYDNYTHATAVALAARLARICQHGWYGSDMQSFHQHAMHYFGENINKTGQYLNQQMLKLTAEETDLSYRPVAFWFALTDLQKHPQAEYQMASLVAPAKQSAGQETGTPIAEQYDAVVSGFDQVKVNNDIELLNNLIKQGADLNSLVKSVVLSLHKTLEFNRVSFLALSSDRLKLESKINLNAKGAGESLKKFEINLKVPDLFAALMKKPQTFVLNENNREKYWEKISGVVKTKIQVENFCVVSIFIGSRPLGVIYADKMDHAIAEEYYRAFQKITMILNRGLALLAQKKSH
ncbi:MAG: HDOD domain-containing protein [Gammaproteobacteria bacterium]|nr:HDOD domain-containing protein [Gammaproteobacteria bacterium]